MGGGNVRVLGSFDCRCTLGRRPASADVEMMCDSAYVSGTVTSQASGFPLAHGIMVTPSVVLPP